VLRPWPGEPTHRVAVTPDLQSTAVALDLPVSSGGRLAARAGMRGAIHPSGQCTCDVLEGPAGFSPAIDEVGSGHTPSELAG
jgi:hypothetical protein